MHNSSESDEDDQSISSDSDSSLDDPNGFASDSFSGKIIHLWGKREDDVVSDYAIAGWMCCVLPDVGKDVREFMCLDNACDAKNPSWWLATGNG